MGVVNKRQLLISSIVIFTVLLLVFGALLIVKLTKHESLPLIDEILSDEPTLIEPLPFEQRIPQKKPLFSPDSYVDVSLVNDSIVKHLKRFDVVVIDPYNVHSKDYVKKVKASGSIVLAKLNIGTAEDWKHYWQNFDKNALIRHDETQEGVYFVDVNNQSWHDAILNYEIPYILKQADSDVTGYYSYDGFVLELVDIIDKFPYMRTGMYKLIKEISLRYPGMLIVQNNGFDILQMTYPFIDGIKYESMCYDFSQIAGKYVPSSNLKNQKQVTSVLRVHNVPVLVLDHIQTSPPNMAAAMNCYKLVTNYNQQGYNFVWNANSVDGELFLWNFLELK